MYELKKIGKVFTSKFVGTGPPSYEKGIYRAAVSRRLGNTGLNHIQKRTCASLHNCCHLMLSLYSSRRTLHLDLTFICFIIY